MNICPNCGAPVRPDQSLCEHCKKPLRNPQTNITKILLAVLAFALALTCFGFVSVREKQLSLEAQQKEQDARKKEADRQLQFAREKEAQKNYFATRTEEEQEIQVTVASEVMEEVEEKSTDTGHTDLSLMAAQNLDPLIEVTGAQKQKKKSDVYMTKDKAVVLTKTKTGFTVELTDECSFSLYTIYVGMTMQEALSYLNSKGFVRDEEELGICYRIDSVDTLYLEGTSERVDGIRLEVEADDRSELYDFDAISQEAYDEAAEEYERLAAEEEAREAEEEAKRAAEEAAKLAAEEAKAAAEAAEAQKRKEAAQAGGQNAPQEQNTQQKVKQQQKPKQQ